jgi:hypothetical protein
MMKNRWTGVIFSCLMLLVIVSGSQAQPFSSDEISIAIPHKVIARMVKATLPMNLEPGPYLKGRLWIHAIDSLKIGTNQVTADLDIRGKNIKLETHLGNQVLSMDVGNFNTALSCKVSLGYDAGKRMLYLTPYILQKPNKNSVNKVADNLLQALSLVNGVAYPIEIQKLEPVIAQISGEQFNIGMEITNIYTENNRVCISGQPQLEKITPPLPE